MLIYFFMLAGVVAAGIPLCSKKCGKSGRIIFCVAAAIAFTVISALRFQVGYDYNLYGGTYFNMKYLTLEEVGANKMEKGFLLPLYVLNLAYEEYYIVFILTSVVIYSAVFYLICKNSSNPWISTAAFMCFGLFFNSLCFLRQFIAALLVTYAVQYISGKSMWRFFVLVFAAACFHWSALLMLGMWLLLKIKPGKIYLAIVAAATTVFCIMSRTLMYWAIDHFYMYKGYDPETNVEASEGLPIQYTIMFGILFIVCFIFRKRLIEKNSANSIYINCLMYTVVFEAMGTRHGILSRFALLVYLPPVLYLIPELVTVVREYISEALENNQARRRVMNVASSCAASIFAIGCYTMLMLCNYNGVVPYVSQMNRPTDIFVEEIIDEEDAEKWDDVDWDEEGYIDEEWEDEEWLDDWDDEEWTDEEWEDEEWEDEEWSEDGFDEEAFEDDILNQLT